MLAQSNSGETLLKSASEAQNYSLDAAARAILNTSEMGRIGGDLYIDSHLRGWKCHRIVYVVLGGSPNWHLPYFEGFANSEVA